MPVACPNVATIVRGHAPNINDDSQNDKANACKDLHGGEDEFE